MSRDYYSGIWALEADTRLAALAPCRVLLFCGTRTISLRRVFWTAARAWRDKARCDAAERGWRFQGSLRGAGSGRGRFLTAGALSFCEIALCCFRVRSATLPFLGGGNFTPARRAFEWPIAIACFADAAPCFPSRMCSISSRTNSPTWVEGALLSSSPFRALSRVLSSSGMTGGFAAAKNCGYVSGASVSYLSRPAPAQDSAKGFRRRRLWRRWAGSWLRNWIWTGAGFINSARIQSPKRKPCLLRAWDRVGNPVALDQWLRAVTTPRGSTAP